MSLIADEGKFRECFERARSCVYIDSGRSPTSLARLVFDDAEILTRKFAILLTHLLQLSGDESCQYIVLDPDPIYYFNANFGGYPLVDLAQDVSPDEYLSKLNQSPDENFGNAVGTNWYEVVITPPSGRWFVHALRSDRDDGGHLWLNPNWTQSVSALYPDATARNEAA